MKKANNALFACLASIALSACGGGSNGSSSSSQAAPISVTTLAGSNGDMSKYLGTWVSDCGYNVIGTNQGKYQTNIFRFTSVNGASVSGTLTIQLYTDPQCGTPVSGGSAGTVSTVTASYQGNLTVTTDSPVRVDGSADQLDLAVTVSNTSQTFTVGFYANYSKFLQGSNSFFNIAALSYSKA